MRSRTSSPTLEWDRGDRAQPDLTTNRLTIERARWRSPGGFPLARYLDAAGFGPATTSSSPQIPPTADEIAELRLTPEMLAKLGGGMPAMLEAAQCDAARYVKALMTAQFLSANAAVLPSEIDDANFAFYGKYLQGRTSQRAALAARDRRRQATCSAKPLGKIYVERHFPPASKAAMDELVGNLRKAMAPTSPSCSG